jgi:prepilin-type N-terminal cleavage/methylation domain-containing protein
MWIDERPLNHTLPRSARGYTMVELVVVLVLVGILAAMAVPKFNAALSARDEGWRDALVSGLRYAQKSAVSHRRLVCMDLGASTITLNIASANPATSCNTALQGPENSTNVFATASTSPGTAVSPAGTLYFQPDGRVTSDGAGNTAANRTITANGIASISIVGETGHVE